MHSAAFLDKLQALLQLATAAALGGQLRPPLEVRWKAVGRRVLRRGRAQLTREQKRLLAEAGKH